MLTSEQDNLVKIYERSFRNHWSLEAITDYGTTRTLTYGAVAEQIDKLHRLFAALGIAKGDKIAVMGRNNCNWVTVYLASLTYGAIIVPILQDFKPNDATHIINHSDSRLLFISDAIWEGMDLEQIEMVQAVFSLTDMHRIATRADESVTWEMVCQAFEQQYPNGMTPDDVHYDDRPNSDIASINYTSGTTGFSKGVITPCNALASHLKFFFTTGRIFQGCRHVAFLPLAHAYGCIVDFLGSLAAGGHTYFIGRTPAPKILLQAFKEVQPTLILSVPLILEKIYKKQIAPQIAKAPVSWVLKVPYLSDFVLDKIRQQLLDAFCLSGEHAQIIIGGAPLNKEVEDFLYRIKFPMTVGYGMTECAPLIAWSAWGESRVGSCGKVLDGYMEARIVDPNEEGIGEIQVRGEHVMAGYYKNEQATAEVFTEDGWLRTGDLGVIDNDGFLYIRGRNKTMLLSANGQNIYPEEIEAKLNNMPYVAESIVLQHDNLLFALVYPDYDAVDQGHLTKDMLEQAMEQVRIDLNQQLASYEQIAKIRLYPHEFEKTPKKSIKRFLYTSMTEDF